MLLRMVEITTENKITILNLMIAIVMTICVMRLFRARGLLKSAISGIVFFTTACYLDRICYLVMVGIANGSTVGEWKKDAIYLVGILMSKVMMGTLIYVGKVFWDTPKEQPLSNQDYKLTYIEGLTVGVSLFFLVLLGGIDRMSLLLTEFCSLLLFFIILCSFYLSAFWYHRRELQQQDAARKEVEKKKADAYLYTIESNYQRTRELWHDLKNHIGLLDLLLQEEKYTEMKAYLRIFNEEVDRITLPAKSGNLIVDAVLADKISLARKEGVTVSLELCDFSTLGLKPDEVCSLLGNLLDNAIEACRQAEQDKWIAVQCKAQENSYYISVRNAVAENQMAYNTAMQGKSQLPMTTKEDMRNGVGHGLGLRSVERVVNRYAGDLLVDGQKGEFVVVVRLPR